MNSTKSDIKCSGKERITCSAYGIRLYISMSLFYYTV